MISSLFIAAMTFIGMVMSFFKLPYIVQYFLKKYHLATDFLVFVFTYITITAISQTIVGLFSATLVAFMADLAIRFFKLMDEDIEIANGFDRRTSQLKRLTVWSLKKIL